MFIPPLPKNEQQRLATIRALNILDSAPEERFDRLTRLAKRLFGVPISLISLIDEDRQWFKSKQGLAEEQTPRYISFCGHTILSDEAFIVPDAKNDERFKDNPLVVDSPGIGFYAGFPLRVADGSKLGTLCLIDKRPRELDKEDLQLLQDLASLAEQELTAIQLATLDELTLISNRRGFLYLSEQALQVCRRKQWPVTLLFFDLDDFKAINDNFGHAEGDRVLISFAEVMRATFRDSDIIARIGGDEFAVLLSDTHEKTVEMVLERFASTINTINRVENLGYEIRYSIGSATFPAGSEIDIQAMTKAADARMYRNKKKNR